MPGYFRFFTWRNSWIFKLVITQHYASVGRMAFRYSNGIFNRRKTFTMYLRKNLSCFLRVLKLFRFNSFKQTFPVLRRWVFSCIKSGLKRTRKMFNLSPIFPITVLKVINRRKLCLSKSKITRYCKKQSF